MPGLSESMPVSLIARQSLVYDGRRILSGQPFTAHSEKDALVLTMIGKAQLALDRERDAHPLEPAVDDIPKPKRVYRRRKAETA